MPAECTQAVGRSTDQWQIGGIPLSVDVEAIDRRVRREIDDGDTVLRARSSYASGSQSTCQSAEFSPRRQEEWILFTDSGKLREPRRLLLPALRRHQ